jgi:arginase
VTLRLLWPQWQGAGTSSVQALAPEFPFEVARRGYAIGSAVLAAVLPVNQGPTAAAPVAMDDTGLELADGIEAKQVILTQLAQALAVIRQHDPARIVTLGGECAVSVAPFSELARRYGQGRHQGSPARAATPPCPGRSKTRRHAAGSRSQLDTRRVRR